MNINEALDIETAPEYGYPQEFALQPWRVLEQRAKVTVVALGAADGRAYLGLDNFDRLLASRAGKPTAGWNLIFDIAFLIADGHYEAVNQIPWVDAMLLWKWYENGILKERVPAWSLVDGAKRWLKDWPLLDQFIALKESEDHTAGVNDHYWQLRGKLDAVATAMIAQRIWDKLSERKRQSAMIEMACLVPVARSWVMGVPMDPDKIEDVAPRINAELKEIEQRLQTHSKVLASPKQLGQLLFEQWGLEPIEGHVSEKTGAPSTDKKHLTYLAERDQRVLEILRWRHLNTQKSKFMEAPVKAFQYLSSNVVHPAPHLYSTYCVPGDVEVLTPDGWQPLNKWEGGEIAQVVGDSCEIVFKHATRFVGPVVENWIRVKHSKIDCLFTHGHTVGYYSQLGSWRAKPAAKAFAEAQVDIPLSGVWANEVRYTPEQTRFICAVHADGYLSAAAGTIKFTFKKQRKIERIRQLLNAVGLPHREYICSAYPDRTEITVRRKDFPAWLPSECKKLDSWTLKLDIPVFLDELVHWDGSYHPDGGFNFSSAKEQDVHWVVTLAALAGRKAGVHRPYLSEYGYMYRCHVSQERPIAQIRKRHTSNEVATHRAYCAETDTGFWLARSNGKIFVTGNTGRVTYASKTKKKYATGVALHQWQRDPEVRSLIQAPPGYKLVEYDASGQEDRLMAEWSQDVTLIRLFNEKGDIHCYTAGSITGKGYDEILRLKKAKDPWVVGDNGVRQAGKFTNHSNKYRIGKKKMRIQAKVAYGLDITLVESGQYQNAFHRSFPGIKRYWGNAITTAKTLGYASTLAGRTFITPERFFAGDDLWSTESSAINFPIQGSGADMKELAIAEMHRAFPDFLFAFDLHDGLFYYVADGTPISRLREAKAFLDNLDYETHWGYKPTVPMIWDGEFGPDWGHMSSLDDAEQEYL